MRSRDEKLLTLFVTVLRGVLLVPNDFDRRKAFWGNEVKCRVCEPLQRSSLKCCCRLAWVGHTIRAVAALVKRPVVPTFILLSVYQASAQT